MSEQRLIDANALLDKQESLHMKGNVLFHGITAFAVENAPTIDPETLPIVRELREKLERVTAERDKAILDLKQASICGTCEQYNPKSKTSKCNIKAKYNPDRNWAGCSNWQWRGINEVKSDD